MKEPCGWPQGLPSSQVGPLGKARWEAPHSLPLLFFKPHRRPRTSRPEGGQTEIRTAYFLLASVKSGNREGKVGLGGGGLQLSPSPYLSGGASHSPPTAVRSQQLLEPVEIHYRPLVSATTKELCPARRRIKQK